ncbi:MAG: FmdB family zinc ribbon protein [bacterium]
MAIYIYLCNKCNRKFDILNGREEAICDVCQNKDVKRVYTAFMIKTSNPGKSVSSCGSCAKTTCSGCK